MPSSAPTGRDSEKFNLRLPDGMRDLIADAAKANGRSMNSEIVARLDQSFAQEATAKEPIFEDIPTTALTKIVDRVVKSMIANGWKQGGR